MGQLFNISRFLLRYTRILWQQHLKAATIILKSVVAIQEGRYNRSLQQSRVAYRAPRTLRTRIVPRMK